MKSKFISPHIIFCVIIFSFMHLFFPSMFNNFEAGSFLTPESDKYLQGALNYHLSGLFKRRIFISNIVSFFSNSLGINITLAFFLTQLAIFTACLGMIHLAGKRVIGKNSPGNLYLFTFSFSVFFAFFKPTYTWDDLFQYFFLLSSLWLVYQKELNLIALFVTLFASLLARETSMMALPGFALLIYLLHPKKTFKALVFMFAGCVSYYLFLKFFIGFSDDTARWETYKHNFKNQKTFIQTLFYCFLTLGVPTLLSFINFKKPNLSPHLKAFFLTVIINTPMVMVAAIVKESRLLSLPLIFLWPVYSSLFSEISVNKIKNFFWKNKFILLAIIILAVSFKSTFRPSKAPASDAFREYLLFYSLFFFYLLFSFLKDNIKRLKKESITNTREARTL